MRWHSMKMWGAAVLSAALLELPFPLAGPMPPWRSIFAWFGLVPLIWAILTPASTDIRGHSGERFCWRICAACSGTWATATGSGTRCFTTATCRRSADVAADCFQPGAWAVFRALWARVDAGPPGDGETRAALIAAPFLWVALELAASRITSVPWDQLGYSQVDNCLA